MRRALFSRVSQVLWALGAIICALVGIWVWLMADCVLTPEAKRWILAACVFGLLNVFTAECEK